MIDQITNNQEICLKVYSQLEKSMILTHSLSCVHNLITSTVLNKKWFSMLPSSVQRELFAGPSTSHMCILLGAIHLLTFLTVVPCAFSSWWVIQNHIDPNAYPLPNSLCHGKDPPEEPFFLEAHFIDNYQWETCYGVAIWSAWDLISEVDQDLMLFYWAARQDY
jgi:hypothetical protein